MHSRNDFIKKYFEEMESKKKEKQQEKPDKWRLEHEIDAFKEFGDKASLVHKKVGLTIKQMMSFPDPVKKWNADFTDKEKQLIKESFADGLRHAKLTCILVVLLCFDEESIDLAREVMEETQIQISQGATGVETNNFIAEVLKRRWGIDVYGQND